MHDPNPARMTQTRARAQASSLGRCLAAHVAAPAACLAIAFRCDDWICVARAASLGYVAVGSRMARASANLLPSVSVLPFLDPSPSRSICLAGRKSNPRKDDFAALRETVLQAHEALLARA